MKITCGEVTSMKALIDIIEKHYGHGFDGLVNLRIFNASMGRERTDYKNLEITTMTDDESEKICFRKITDVVTIWKGTGFLDRIRGWFK